MKTKTKPATRIRQRQKLTYSQVQEIERRVQHHLKNTGSIIAQLEEIKGRYDDPTSFVPDQLAHAIDHLQQSRDLSVSAFENVTEVGNRYRDFFN